jgi:hypothetical protein
MQINEHNIYKTLRVNSFILFKLNAIELRELTSQKKIKSFLVHNKPRNINLPAKMLLVFADSIIGETILTDKYPNYNNLDGGGVFYGEHNPFKKVGKKWIWETHYYNEYEKNIPLAEIGEELKHRWRYIEFKETDQFNRKGIQRR